MPLSPRTLNRTLWVRQQLVPAHSAGISDPIAMTRHLIGLQAQENLSPYLSLAARIPDFDPLSLSDALADRRLVRLLSLRGTVHVLTPEDAVAVRPWVQPALDAISRNNAQSRPARDVSSDELRAAAAAALTDGPLPVAELGDRLAVVFPDAPVAALRNAARERVPLAQVPPRGLWKQSGGVVYALVMTWLQRSLADVDPRDLVRRYLRAFGPASAADMTKWSSVTGPAAVFGSMRDELVEHTTEQGKPLWDVPDGDIVDSDLELPPVLLGNYDNLWLSHADRSRIATDVIASGGWVRTAASALAYSSTACSRVSGGATATRWRSSRSGSSRVASRPASTWRSTGSGPCCAGSPNQTFLIAEISNSRVILSLTSTPPVSSAAL